MNCFEWLETKGNLYYSFYKHFFWNFFLHILLIHGPSCCLLPAKPVLTTEVPNPRVGRVAPFGGSENESGPGPSPSSWGLWGILGDSWLVDTSFQALPLHMAVFPVCISEVFESVSLQNLNCLSHQPGTQ